MNHGLRKVEFSKLINQKDWLPIQLDGHGDYGGGGILKFFRYKERIICIDEFTDEIVVDNPYEEFIRVLLGLKEHNDIIPKLERE